jgi:cell division ATPase FtsA
MYERKYNQTIEGAILVGGGARVLGALEAYKQVVHLPVVIGTPFEQVKVPDFLSEMMSRIGPSYAVAVGLALKKLIS